MGCHQRGRDEYDLLDMYGLVSSEKGVGLPKPSKGKGVGSRGMYRLKERDALTVEQWLGDGHKRGKFAFERSGGGGIVD